MAARAGNGRPERRGQLPGGPPAAAAGTAPQSFIRAMSRD
jgi:hypothetical protein